MPAEQTHTMALIDRLCAPSLGAFTPMRVAIVAAHPDDEVLGAGSRLSRLGPHAAVVWITDGSPWDARDAYAAGFSSRDEYALARRRESESALSIAAIKPDQCHWLGIVDRESIYHLVEIVQKLVAVLETINPDLILTHPYEGGHPDHDSVSFAVAAAVNITRGRSKRPCVAEFTSYNAGADGEGWSTDFLHDPGSLVRTLELSEEEQSLKRRLMKCYASQKWILEVFSDKVERFRPAPEYDYAQPPYRGKLFYERMPWGITGSDWRALVRNAAAEMGIR